MCITTNVAFRIPASKISVQTNARLIAISGLDSLCQGRKRILMYVGYAWANLPFKEDYDAAIYADDEFRLPGAMWRCRAQYDEEWNLRGCKINEHNSGEKT